MLTPLTKRNIARDRFGASASVYGAKGGKVCSEKKKAAGANSLRIARYVKMVKAAERKELFAVGTIVGDRAFVGSWSSCMKFCRARDFTESAIYEARSEDIPKPNFIENKK